MFGESNARKKFQNTFFEKYFTKKPTKEKQIEADKAFIPSGR